MQQVLTPFLTAMVRSISSIREEESTNFGDEGGASIYLPDESSGGDRTGSEVLAM